MRHIGFMASCVLPPDILMEEVLLMAREQCCFYQKKFIIEIWKFGPRCSPLPAPVEQVDGELISDKITAAFPTSKHEFASFGSGLFF